MSHSLRRLTAVLLVVLTASPAWALRERQVSTTAHPTCFKMVDSADSKTGKTGLTVTCTVLKNGTGSFGSLSGSIAEISSGWYCLAGNATDRNTVGPIGYHCTASGADANDFDGDIVTYDPYLYPDTSSTIAAVTTATTCTTASTCSAIGSGGITSSSFASGAINAAAIATDAIGAAELAADAVTEIQSGLATSSAVAGVQSDTDDIQGRLPSALTGAGNLKADAQVVSDKTGYSLTSAYDPAKTAAQVSDIPTAAAISDQVWDEATSGHQTAGTTGLALTSGSAPSAATNAAAVWDYLTADADTASSMGALVVDKLPLISAGSITIRPPVPLDGSFEIVAGDSYQNSQGRAIDFPVGSKPWPTDLTTWTVTITVVAADGSTLISDSLSVVTATGSSRKVRWQPTATKTDVAPGSWRYWVVATSGSDVSTLEVGVVRIKAGA